ncbi:hypothetical protein EYF80_064533 [Liparis tanakae]|uniref:Uncharacterized protein n=1 Tax=Liparis tanakae TaxID=230148 RepID=A0A4Z2E967_9TELE|nr:hypothetical protein EYF80_064533 [Liparis tanakae]
MLTREAAFRFIRGLYLDSSVSIWSFIVSARRKHGGRRAQLDAQREAEEEEEEEERDRNPADRREKEKKRGASRVPRARPPEQRPARAGLSLRFRLVLLLLDSNPSCRDTHAHALRVQPGSGGRVRLCA